MITAGGMEMETTQIEFNPVELRNLDIILTADYRAATEELDKEVIRQLVNKIRTARWFWDNAKTWQTELLP